jgi:Ca2+-binding EF-hand superfamily protein
MSVMGGKYFLMVMALISYCQYVTAGECEDMEDIQEDFKALDRDVDGKITFDEIMYFQYDRFPPIPCHSRKHFPGSDELFAARDVNGDGNLCPDERRAAAVEEFQGLLNLIDTNSDGSIDSEEFYVFKRKSSSPQDDRLNFNRIDANGDGKISLEEIYQALEAINFADKCYSVKDYGESSDFRKMDEKGDGVVCPKEGLTYLKKRFEARFNYADSSILKRNSCGRCGKGLMRWILTGMGN